MSRDELAAQNSGFLLNYVRVNAPDWYQILRAAFNADDILHETLVEEALFVRHVCRSEIEQLAEDSGQTCFGIPHKVLFSPPYYSDLNAIENVWGIAKGEVAKRAVATFKELRDKHLPRAMQSVSPETWTKRIARMRTGG